MQVTPLIWIITIAVTIAFFVYEFFAHVRKPHEPTIGESARWSAFYIGLALLFGVGIGMVSGWDFGGQYFAVQPMWSNEANGGSGGCAMARGTGPAPVPSTLP